MHRCLDCVVAFASTPLRTAIEEGSAHDVIQEEK
jgi:hypothetical protein